MYTRKKIGIDGENAVATWLENNSFTVLARNYATRRGEVDIIATKDDVVAFIEVKTRQTYYFPITQTITFTKQQRIIKAAQHFILTHQLHDKVFRFDVALVICNNNTYNIEYIDNAFQKAF